MAGAGGRDDRRYRCELCDVTTTSHEQLQSHLGGRMHILMVQRSEVAKRSVYVRGFSESTSAERELREVMGQFGCVDSVMLVRSENGDCYCLVEFRFSEAALRALQHPSPITLHTHTLTVKPRQVTATRPKRKPRLSRRQCVDVVTTATKTTAREVGGEGEMVGGIRLTSEAVAAISAAHSINTQLEAIALHCRVSNAVAKKQLELSWQLQSMFRRYMPSCLVIPFGAPFSGHGMVSSDCDLCLLLRPHPLDVSIFSGPNYLPSHLHSFWESLKATPPADLLPAGGVAVGGVVQELKYNDVMHIVMSSGMFSKVLPVRHARVPIIRFVYQSFQLHCDLSINNRLGPANTRLLAAYMNFDQRMAVLVPCVRLWAKGCGLSRTQMNSYAISLLLIHSLQQTSPPVLPCLQEPGVWPKNMSFIGGCGLRAERRVLCSGWECSFADPHSLLPSSNTTSAAQLLLHFFHYYTNLFSFSTHMVAIHTLYPPLLAHRGQSARFKISSLCVQDPFDRSHNVTKNVKIAGQIQLLRAMKATKLQLAELVSSGQTAPGTNILSLFRPATAETSANTAPNKANGEHTLQLNMSIVSHLLHDTQYTALENRLSELDLTNELIQLKLSNILLHSIAHHLEKEFGFKVQPVRQKKEVAMTPDPSPPTPHAAVETNPGTGQVCKRSRQSCEEDEMMDVEEGPEGGSEREEAVKRLRMATPDSVEQLLFHFTEDQGSEFTLECVAVEESWVGRRRKRRDQQATESQPPPSTPPSAPPCLALTLSAVVSPQSTRDAPIATVKLQTTDPKYQPAFHQFFAVYKKWLQELS